ASYFLDAGCDVTIVEMLPKIAGPTDADLSNRLLAEYKKRGIKFMLSTKVTSVEADGLTCEAGSVSEKIGCDLILLAAGRRAVTKGFGLETLAPAMSRAGIITNEYTETNVPGLFAIGDCNGTSMLAHTAYREAETAVELFKGRKVPVRYDCIPSVIYTDPEIASVGLTKEAALGRGLRVKEVKVPLSYSGRYIAENIKGLGFLKLVVDTDRNCIVGVHMMGSYASEIIAAAAIIVETELPIERLKQFVFPHPTVSEVLHEAFNQI
ncbi:MAG: FAD-dependent oxidoreductase, partial [Clostridia bacterium]|nr:FAD-dependent oxidoreductase [Clostridia bacterium]